jgi:hypothetical protein
MLDQNVAWFASRRTQHAIKLDPPLGRRLRKYSNEAAIQNNAIRSVI